MRDFKSKVTTLALLSSFISPLSQVYSQAAVIGDQPLLANDWVGEQMAKIKEQSPFIIRKTKSSSFAKRIVNCV